MSAGTHFTVVFRMNGVAAGYLREYGCQQCPRCSSSAPQAHISASLLIKRHGYRSKSLQTHLLFDCGVGAIDSLIEFGAPPVDRLFISHGHPYHSLGLDRLMWGQFSHYGRSELPLTCTSDTLLAGPKRIYPWFFGDEPRRIVPELVKPLDPQPFDLGIGLKITAVPVFQGSSAPGAVIWVVEFGNRERGTYRKLVLGWELIHFIPRHVPGGIGSQGEDQSSEHDQGETVDRNLGDTFGPIFDDVDELFFDGNTITPQPGTNHMSIEAALRFLIPQINPQRSWIVHYSGHEDACGPLTDDQLQDWVDREKQQPRYGLSASEIKVAKHGMLLAFEL